MSSVTHLEQFRGPRRFELSRRPNHKSQNEGTKLRELWSDGLATLAVVVLASLVAFETLRVLLW